MSRNVSRRRLLALGGAVLSSGAIAAAGLSNGRRDAPYEAQWPYDEIHIDEADPTATPFAITGGGSLQGPPPGFSVNFPAPGAEPTAARPVKHHGLHRPAWDSAILRQVLRSGPTERPYVALTIDDGWSARDGVLRVLQEKKVSPTLFLAGRPIAGDRGFVARALDTGCEIANHTMDHYTLTDKSVAYIQKDLQDFEELVRAQATGATTIPYMRPSGGSVNQTVIDASAAAGYRVILWSASVGDGSTATTPAQMTANALNAAKPGAIILMHFSDRAVAALPAIIDGIRARGLEPVSLSRLFEPDPPSPI